jgi:hypothetical protein
MEVSALRDLDSFSSHQAGQRSIAPKINTITGVNISEHPTEDDDFASRYIGKHFGILRYRDAAVGNPAHPFHIALNDQ